MWVYTFKSQFISVTKKKSDHQGCDYKGGLLYMQKQICKISQKISILCFLPILELLDQFSIPPWSLIIDTLGLDDDSFLMSNVESVIYN